MIRKCIIDACEHDVYPMFDVDVGIGVYYSNEIPICEDCLNSEDDKIKKQIKELLKDYDSLPF